MHEHIFQRTCRVVRLGCKAGQPFLEKKDPQRLARRHQHVQSQIELESIYEIRTPDVALHDHVCLACEFVDFAGQKDALALRSRFWLHDQRDGGFALGTVVSELVEVVGEHPG